MRWLGGWHSLTAGTFLPACSMVPSTISIYGGNREFLVTSGVVVVLEFSSELHDLAPYSRREVGTGLSDSRWDVSSLQQYIAVWGRMGAASMQSWPSYSQR
jgi:hypothetical protein